MPSAEGPDQQTANNIEQPKHDFQALFLTNNSSINEDFKKL